MFDDEAQALIETAHLYGKKVAVHAHGADGIDLALKYGADSIEHGTLLDEEEREAVPEERRLLRADAVDRERLPRTAREGSERVSARGAREDRVAHLDHGQGARSSRIRAA